MKTMRGVLALLMLGVLVVSSIGCEAMPVTMTPYASYGGSGIDYGYSSTRQDPSHQWQVGASASFVLGARGVVANAVPTPSLPSNINVNNSASNNNNNSAAGGNTTNNTNNGVINNGTVNGGIK